MKVWYGRVKRTPTEGGNEIMRVCELNKEDCRKRHQVKVQVKWQLVCRDVKEWKALQEGVVRSAKEM